MHLFNDSLVFQNSFEITDESEFQLIDIGPEGLGLAGMETYGSTMPSGGTKSVFAKSYSFAGDNYDMSRDIGVVDVQLGEVTHVSPGPFTGYYRIYFNDAHVTVQNFGDDTVNDFYIRSQASSFVAGITQHFEGVSLGAGETATLALDDYWVGSSAGLGGMENVCMWTSHPDKRLDEDSTNDGYCAGFLVANEEQKEGLSFNIYPNPSTSFTMIEYQLPAGTAATITVFDCLGRQVDGFPVSLASGTLELPHYPAGLYVVSLAVAGEVVKTEKLVRL